MSTLNFDDFLSALDDDPFDEHPVDVRTFVHDEMYLGQPELSDIQYDVVEAGSQIYRLEDLMRFMDEKEAKQHYDKYTKNEVILQCGKGSGKDYVSTVTTAYVVYKLLCLKDPAKYFGKPSGDAIDIINIAINAQQAKNVFFKGFKLKIERSPWFAGKYDAKADNIEFDKAVTVYSGHSERESHEGLNLILAVLDEISGFAQDSVSGNENAKTGDAIYKAFRASVDSRFPDFGKVLLLSFPRYQGDFISKRYSEVILEKETVLKNHSFLINPDLGDIEGNQFSIEWEEDHIVSYALPHIFALKRPTWDFNPVRTIKDFTIAFYDDPMDSLMRFACMPPEATDAFFKSREKIEKAFDNPKIAIDTHGRFSDWFKPDPDKEYFIHVDLAQKHDNCAVALAHVDSWVQMKIAGTMTEAAPRVIVDAVRYWQPTSTTSVDLSEVKEYIISLRERGFNLNLVTFDRWNSHDMMQQLKHYGINTQLLSVAKRHYEDMSLLITEERLHGPEIKILIDELLQLRIRGDKVDHPRKGSKDLADAVCGSVFNAITHSRRNSLQEIEIYSYDMLEQDSEEEIQLRMGRKRNESLIIPPQLQNAIDSMEII